jgi:hypothetical protein
MKRRRAIQIVALGALAPRLDGAMRMPTGSAWSAKDYKLRFFSSEENELADQVMEMIIPADHHSPGAHAAQVSLFADRMVATSDATVKARWRRGLRLLQEEASHSSLQAALAKAALHEGQPQTQLERFFGTLKDMTVNGYYTSSIGIHQDLQYQGNTYLASFPGCQIKKMVEGES